MTVDTARVALRRAPWRFLITSWPWRSIAYLATGTYLLPVALLSWIVRFPPAGSPRGLIARIERHRLRLMVTSPAPARPAARASTRTTAWQRAAPLVALCLIASPVNLVLLVALGAGVSMMLLPLLTVATRTTYAWESLLVPATATVVTGLAAALTSLYAITAIAVLQAHAARRMLSRPDGLDAGAAEALLADLDAERQRIEQDLHDGSQQRLVALGLTLAQAEMMLPETEPAAALVARARQETDQTLVELRELIRGVHPQVLTERGLAAAIADLTERQTFPVSVEIVVPERLPNSVESTAYFLASEALTNIGKHSRANSVRVTVRVAGGRLTIQIADNGVGGARVDDRATGIRGMARRVQALGGGLTVSSPPGGPTVLRAHLPTRPS